MQWGQIKTLFILCFLILDIFLVRQYFLNQDEDLGTLQTPTNEELLEANVEGLDKLDKEIRKESIITTKQVDFTTRDTELEGLTNQSLTILEDNTLVSALDTPVPIKKEATDEEIKQIVTGFVPYGEQYTLWGKNEATNTLILFQLKGDKPIFYNEGGLLLVFLNEKNEAMYYMQTMLEEIDLEDQAELEKEIMTPYQAVSQVYFNADNLLTDGSEILEVMEKPTLGYLTLAPLSDGEQVFAPTWKINFNDSNNYFINAIEGLILTKDENFFIKETLNGVVASMTNKPIKEENEALNTIKQKLLQVLDTTNWSGEE
ncbi:two-component system regulatory protein YycI [Radiobacillus kanasensis]|uniref:two-component system regulatory protein YycI n=1 Tax=Radiobacillus kanasensis TaxID=2844358 RepID=UPI001E444D0A|nr:two-component system regulatory protein YycI [Radiobacillus kanasensis]UFT99390.1 two-component system regulatory protein YycI [Radiobacillus kanasensis]